LPANPDVAARVVHCISLGPLEHFWLLGLALNESGNVWGLENVPEDWKEQDNQPDDWNDGYFDQRDRKRQA